MPFIHVKDLDFEPQHVVENLLRAEQYEDDYTDFEFEELAPKKKKSKNETEDE